MYKKIKNGSFMNLIWFILATLPFVLLLIYAIGFFNNEDLKNNGTNEITLYGQNVGNNFNTNNTNYTILNCETENLEFNSNYTYYTDMGGGEYGTYEFVTQDTITSEVYYEYRNELYIIELKELITINNNFNDFLTNINATIQTNGFISNAFLNLSQFFGVTNVYYSLACYYIEYLLIIILLHLAFDLLYIVPNICHKFMEKIGGERD